MTDKPPVSFADSPLYTRGTNYGFPAAVPKIPLRHLSRRNFDRGHSLTSLYLPLAALGSLPTPRRPMMRCSIVGWL